MINQLQVLHRCLLHHSHPGIYHPLDSNTLGKDGRAEVQPAGTSPRHRGHTLLHRGAAAQGLRAEACLHDWKGPWHSGRNNSSACRFLGTLRMHLQHRRCRMAGTLGLPEAVAVLPCADIPQACHHDRHPGDKDTCLRGGASSFRGQRSVCIQVFRYSWTI